MGSEKHPQTKTANAQYAPGHEWLRIEEIALDVRLASKRSVLDELSRLLATRLGVTPSTILAALWQREDVGSTALGRGMALPHARLPQLETAVGAFVRLQLPVAFDAPDDEPVVFVPALLLPTHDAQQQLNLLAEVAGKFSETRFREQLTDARDAGEVRDLLTLGTAP